MDIRTITIAEPMLCIPIGGLPDWIEIRGRKSIPDGPLDDEYPVMGYVKPVASYSGGAPITIDGRVADLVDLVRWRPASPGCVVTAYAEQDNDEYNRLVALRIVTTPKV